MRTLQDVMSTPVRTVDVAEVVGPVRDLMLDEGLHGLPVLDHDGVLAGIVTAADLVEEWAPEQGIATVMSTDVHTVSPFTTTIDAARAMLDHRIHHLVVVGGRGEVVGMVSSFDLLSLLAGEVEAASSLGAPGRPIARPGDVVVIRGHAIDRAERRGIITGVRGPEGGPPFVVQWLDDPHAEPHDVLFFPGSDADIEHSSATADATAD